jgi:hypothetical protein
MRTWEKEIEKLHTIVQQAKKKGSRYKSALLPERKMRGGSLDTISANANGNEASDRSALSCGSELSAVKYSVVQ